MDTKDLLAWRQYATAALQGIIVNPTDWKITNSSKERVTLGDYMEIAAIVADSMLKQQKKREKLPTPSEEK